MKIINLIIGKKQYNLKQTQIITKMMDLINLDIQHNYLVYLKIIKNIVLKNAKDCILINVKEILY